MCAELPQIYATLSPGQNLATLRRALFDQVLARTAASRAPDIPSSALPDQKPAKVTSDAVSDDAEQIYREVGLDTLALALLADVPVHRPLHLTHNNLIGHWRWLRQVWRTCAYLPRVADPVTLMEMQPDVIAAIQQGRNNTAIALLRQSFQQLIADGNVETGTGYQTFLANLSVFCPFIGTELLWRQGLIVAPKDKRHV